MLKIAVRKWDRNRNRLLDKLREQHEIDLLNCNYLDLVKLTFKTLFTEDEDDGECYYRLNTDDIVEIDHGNYQGTLLFVIPFLCYQPAEFEYLMTYVEYGSCSGCDTLLSLQSNLEIGEEPSVEVLTQFTLLCKDLITNMIKPYNCYWRKDEWFEPLTVEN